METLAKIEATLLGPEVQTLVPLAAQVIKMLTGKDLAAEAAAAVEMVGVVCKNLQIVCRKAQ